MGEGKEEREGGREEGKVERREGGREGCLSAGEQEPDAPFHSLINISLFLNKSAIELSLAVEEQLAGS